MIEIGPHNLDPVPFRRENYRHTIHLDVLNDRIFSIDIYVGIRRILRKIQKISRRVSIIYSRKNRGRRVASRNPREYTTESTLPSIHPARKRSYPDFAQGSARNTPRLLELRNCRPACESSVLRRSQPWLQYIQITTASRSCSNTTPLRRNTF